MQENRATVKVLRIKLISRLQMALVRNHFCNMEHKDSIACATSGFQIQGCSSCLLDEGSRDMNLQHIHHSQFDLQQRLSDF